MDWVFAVVLLALVLVSPWVGVRLYRRFCVAGAWERTRLYGTVIGFGALLAAIAEAYALSTGRFDAVLPFSGPSRLADVPGLPGDFATNVLPGLLSGAIAGALLGTVMVLVPKVSSRVLRAAGDFTGLFPRSARERWLCLIVAVSAAFGEELAFRGALLDLVQRLLPHHALGPAALVAVALFGLANLYQGVRGVLTTTLAGALLMGVFLGAGSLWPAIALHFVIDLKLALVRLPSPAPLAA